MKRLSISLVVLILIGGLAQAQGYTSSQNAMKEPMALRGSINGLESPLTVPITYQDGLILIHLKMDGKERTFLFDTGAELSIIATELIGNSPIMDTLPVTDIKAADVSQYAKILKKDLSFEGVSFSDVICCAMDITPLRQAACLPVDGILGANIIRLCNWKIDPVLRTITLSKKSFGDEEDFSAINLAMARTLPLIKLSIGGQSLWVLLDSGYLGVLQLNDKFYFDNRKLRKLPIASGKGMSSVTINQKVNSKIYFAEIDSLYLDSLLLRNVNTIIETGKPALGAKFLRNYITILDLKDSMVYLKKVSAEMIDNHADKRVFGISFLPEQNALMVSFVWKNSPAQKAGIRYGDLVLSVDGKPSSEFIGNGFCRLKTLLDNKDKINVTIRSKRDKVKKMVLTKYDLLQ